MELCTVRHCKFQGLVFLQRKLPERGVWRNPWGSCHYHLMPPAGAQMVRSSPGSLSSPLMNRWNRMVRVLIEWGLNINCMPWNIYVYLFIQNPSWIYLWIYLSVNLSCTSIGLSIYLSSYLTFYLSIYPSILPSIYLSVYVMNTTLWSPYRLWNTLILTSINIPPNTLGAFGRCILGPTASLPWRALTRKPSVVVGSPCGSQLV